jgi:hypothetical protein
MTSALIISTPALPLFHYTTAQALPSILEKRKLWASSIHCLNDAQEYRYAFALTRELCRTGVDIPPPHSDDILEWLDGPYAGFESQSRFVASFSEAPDLLSQWRAYGGKGPAFSIGFEPAALVDIARLNRCELVRCVYKRDEQVALLKELLARILALHAPIISGASVSVPGLPTEFVSGLLDLAVTFKHPSFEEEREWRLATDSRPSAGGGIKFRSGMSLLVPYIELDLARPHTPLQLSRAVVGPTAQPELSREILIDALKTYGCIARPEAVVKSEIPFRGWW